MKLVSYINIILLGFIIFSSKAFAGAEAGKPAPSLIVNDITGRIFDLSKLRGKVVIVHFWATWCANCITEMPELDSFYRNNRDKGLEIMALSLDRPVYAEKVKTMMNKFAYRAALINEESVNGFGTQKVVPATYVIDKNGILSNIIIPGEIVVNQKNLDRIITPLLNEYYLK